MSIMSFGSILMDFEVIWNTFSKTKFRPWKCLFHLFLLWELTIAAYFVIRENFEIPNDALEQPKLNILTWLKVLKSSTKFGDFKNFGREVKNFDGARRIFYEVKWHILSIFKKIWPIKICIDANKSSPKWLLWHCETSNKFTKVNIS